MASEAIIKRERKVSQVPQPDSIFGYIGILLCATGVVLVFFFGLVVVCAKREEKLLTQQFPDAYPAYKKRTKMLIPFVL